MYSIDFSTANEDAVHWLKQQGFTAKQNAKDLHLSLEKKQIWFESVKKTFGFYAKELTPQEATHLRIEWGVEKYPEGSDWDQKIRREAIAVIVSFGTEKISSGSLFVPNLPYFISIFLEKNAQPKKLYEGRYFKEGGRYYCASEPSLWYETIVSEIDLSDLFERSFQKKILPITGIAMEVDTSATKGKSKAFIKNIEFFNHASI